MHNDMILSTQMETQHSFWRSGTCFAQSGLAENVHVKRAQELRDDTVCLPSTNSTAKIGLWCGRMLLLTMSQRTGWLVTPDHDSDCAIRRAQPQQSFASGTMNKSQKRLPESADQT